MYIIRRKNKIG